MWQASLPILLGYGFLERESMSATIHYLPIRILLRSRRVAMLLGILGLVLGASLQTYSAPARITRGPYLQIGTQTNLIVRFRTDLSIEARVAYGTNQLMLDQVVTRTGSRTQHSFLLHNLIPGTRYYYAIGTSSTWLLEGPELTFKTAPADTQPVRIWAIGDSGTAAVGNFGSYDVRDAYLHFNGNQHTDVWLMLGDNAYNSGTDLQYQRAVFDTYPTLLRNTVLWPTIGNHETYSADEDGHFPYLDIFTLPQNGQAGGVASGTIRYYSFDYSNIHFVCLDSETSGLMPDDPMPTWLNEDLMATTKDWIIVYWHSPPYSKGSHDSDLESPLIEMRERIVPILEQYGVDLVLCGHSHNYERSYLLHGHYGISSTLTPSMILDSGSGRTNESGPYLKVPVEGQPPSGTVYVVAGSSGWATETNGHHPVMHSQYLYTGSMVIDVNGPRLDAKFLRATEAVADYFTILKTQYEQEFTVVQIALDQGHEVVRWASRPGQNYIVHWTETLDPPDWFAVSSAILASGSVTSWTNSMPQGLSQSYYRVVEVQD